MQAQCVERTDRLYNGELRFEMSDAEFRVAKEQPAIHTMNAPKDLTDNNMKLLNRDAGNAAPGGLLVGIKRSCKHRLLVCSLSIRTGNATLAEREAIRLSKWTNLSLKS